MKAGPRGNALQLSQALQHQRLVCEAIAALYNVGSYSALSRGGSRVFEKLIRSYHYWVEEHSPGGICPYNKPRLGYFRMSPGASTAAVE